MERARSMVGEPLEIRPVRDPKSRSTSLSTAETFGASNLVRAIFGAYLNRIEQKLDLEYMINGQLGSAEQLDLMNLGVIVAGGKIVDEIRRVVNGGQSSADATYLRSMKTVALSDVICAMQSDLPFPDSIPLPSTPTHLSFWTWILCKLKAKRNPIKSFFTVMENPGKCIRVDYVERLHEDVDNPKQELSRTQPPQLASHPLPPPPFSPISPLPPSFHQTYMRHLADHLVPSYPSRATHLYETLLIFLRTFAHKIPFRYISGHSQEAIRNYQLRCLEHRQQFPEGLLPFPYHSEALEMALGIHDAYKNWCNKALKECIHNTLFSGAQAWLIAELWAQKPHLECSNASLAIQ